MRQITKNTVLLDGFEGLLKDVLTIMALLFTHGIILFSSLTNYV